MAQQQRWRRAAGIASNFLLVLFVVACLQAFTRLPLAAFGVVPRTLWGLNGILFAPLLHGSWAHLFANSLPLWILTLLLFADPRYKPWSTLCVIWFAAGFGTWLIGRGGAIHLGASGIIFGEVAYLLFCGFLMRSWRAAFVALAVFVFFGGIFYGVLPQQNGVSWEGHLCGALGGFWAAWRTHR
jgi:membrane associated rhomboid family serine protease